MKRPLSAGLLAVFSRLLMNVALQLLGAHRATWGRAMQAEMEAIGPKGEALAFAWGCCRAAIGHAFTQTLSRWAQVHNAGVVACCAAVLLGCAYMHSAGAPGHYAALNLLSLAFAVASFRLLPLRRLQLDELLRARLSFALGALLLAASLDLSSTGAAAWLRIGPVHLNLLWLLLPALLVASDVRQLPAARPWALVGLLMACSALALLADALLAGVVAAVLGVRAWRRRSLAMALLSAATGAASLHLGQRWQVPEAAPFVDVVLQSGFEQGLTIGLALALLQVLLLWPALLHRQARQHGLVWALLVVLSLPGWLPSPLVGFGGSFIVGYLLSLAVLPGDVAHRPITGPAHAATRPRLEPPSCSRSGLT
jgi:hypothetical protein